MTLPFLLQLVNYLKENFSEKLADITLILPNKRASVFIKKHFKEVYAGETIWLPEILTIEEFLVELSGFSRLSTIELLFAFYEVYRNFEIQNKRSPQEFKDFMGWATFLLNDFNEIDKSNADAEKVFNYLTDLKAMELWSPANVDDYNFTKLQANYLQFWHTFKPLYFSLKGTLHNERTGYDGLILQYCILNFDELSKKFMHKKIIFCGFNALNFAEEKLITLFCKYANALTLWDADIYYVGNKAHEAGKFLRKYVERDAFKNKISNNAEFCWLNNDLSTQEKNIEVIGVASNVGQVKYAGSVLNDLNINDNTAQSTALVLANEQLLEASLNSLPEGLNKINVTMGFPVKNTEAVSWTESLIRLFAEKKPNNSFYYFKTFLSFVQNPLSKIVFTEKLTNRFVSMVERENAVWLSPEFIGENFKSFLQVDALQKIFSGKKYTINEFVSLLCDFLEVALERILLSNSNNPIQSESVIILKETLVEFAELNKKYNAVITLQDLLIVFRQLINSGKISFVGEPIGGLQILGVLETRTLDFDNLVMVACNEDVFPVISKNITFLTAEIKKEFGILANSDKEAIFAYHFYRLIQRAKKITIIYNTEPGEFGGSGEMSRYVTQLLYELPKANPNVNITHKIISLKNKEAETLEFSEVSKTEEAISAIHESIKDGFSASALNMYRNCSMKFYYRKVLRLKEKEVVEEEMQADTYGTIFHDTVESLFIPYMNTVLSLNSIKLEQSAIHSKLTQSFLKHFSAFEFSTGKNYLKFVTIEKQLKKLLSYFETLINKNSVIEILGVEHNASFELLMPDNTKLLLQGKIDMILRINGQAKIVDFKTGKVEAKDLSIKNILEDLTLKPMDKAFQLLFYAFLINNTIYELQPINTMIYSVKNFGMGFMPLKIGNEEIISNLEMNDFKSYLQSLIVEIFNGDIPFHKTADLKICEYCDYRNLCNR